jgi:hypothetical protein
MMYMKFALVFATLASTFFAGHALATSTIRCEGDGPESYRLFVQYNVGFGMPTSLTAGVMLSDEIVSINNPNQFDPTVYLLTGYFSDEVETRIHVSSEDGALIMTLKTKKNGEREWGFVKFVDQKQKVTCKQIG